MESSSSSLDIPTGETEMTELTEGVGDVGLEEAEEEADNGRICNEWWLPVRGHFSSSAKTITRIIVNW